MRDGDRLDEQVAEVGQFAVPVGVSGRSVLHVGGPSSGSRHGLGHRGAPPQASHSIRGARPVQHKLLSKEGNRMRLSNVAAATATILAVTAGAATAAVPITGVAAVKKAQACLTAHGAVAVGSGITGNGDVSFGAGQNAQWKYRLAKAWPLQNGLVLGVASISYDKRMTAGKRLVVKRCVYSVVPAAK